MRGGPTSCPCGGRWSTATAANPLGAPAPAGPLAAAHATGRRRSSSGRAARRLAGAGAEARRRAGRIGRVRAASAARSPGGRAQASARSSAFSGVHRGAARRRSRPPTARQLPRPVARSETPRGPVRRSTPRDQEQPGVEDRCGIRALDVLEEGRVHRSGESSRVRKTTRRPDRIGGVWVATLTPATSSSARLRWASRSRLRVTPERLQHRGVELDHVGAGVQAEHLELGAAPARRRSSRAARWPGRVRGVAQVQGQLDRLLGGGDRRPPRPGTAPQPRGSHVVRALRPRARREPGDRARTGALPSPGGRAAGRAVGRPAPAVQLDDLQQQVAPGDPARAGAAAAARPTAQCRRGCRSRRRPPAARPPAGETRARCQKSASAAYGRPATIRATSASLIPLTSASESRMP